MKIDGIGTRIRDGIFKLNPTEICCLMEKIYLN